MNNLSVIPEVIRKIGVLALIGFAVLMLSGPVVALLSLFLSLALVLLPFVAVGLLVWLPFRLLNPGRNTAMPELHDAYHRAERVAGRFRQTLRQAITTAPRLAGRLLAGVFRIAWGAVGLTFSATRVVVEMAMVTATGAFIGVIAGILTGHNLAAAILTNAIAGGLIGAAAGLVMLIRDRRAAAPRPTQFVA